MRSQTTRIAALASIGLAALSGCGNDAPRDPSQWPIALVELERGQTPADPGEAAYRRTCIACHGRDGRGNGNTTGADFGSPTGVLTHPDAELLVSIRDGKVGSIGTMPAHRALLSDAEQIAVLAYVRTTFGANVVVVVPAAAGADAGAPDAALAAAPAPSPAP
jgi:mono/diheme cytochrome c family protein